MFVSWPEATYDTVRQLLSDGLTIGAVAEATGVPRGTVARWKRRSGRRQRGAAPDPNWRPPDERAYAYLLGLYLGDGHIVVNGRSAMLVLALDATYPAIVDEASAAMRAVMPESSLRRYAWPHRGQVTDLRASHPNWLVAFPQHGPGKKHLRRIELEPWQRAITHAHPRALIRGLVHSDGCRSVNRFATRLPGGRVAEYAYARYFFSNLSEDIKDVFCEHCDLLGIRWSRANPRYVSVHDRRSVALLDGFVGPKR